MNCQGAGDYMRSSVASNQGSVNSNQPLQAIDSGSPNLAMSPLSSTMGMSPVGIGQQKLVGISACSPMGISPMGPQHHGYATPVSSSAIHTSHPHNGALSPMNDVKSLCYARGVYDNGKLHVNTFPLMLDHQ